MFFFDKSKLCIQQYLYLKKIHPKGEIRKYLILWFARQGTNTISCHSSLEHNSNPISQSPTVNGWFGENRPKESCRLEPGNQEETG